MLNRFIGDYRAKGAKVLLVYAPLCEVQGEFAQQYEAVIAAQLDAPVLFPIELAATRLDEHYDTDAHLNWEGVCHRMEVMTTHLDQHLTPRVATSPAEHGATRRRALQSQLCREGHALAEALVVCTQAHRASKGSATNDVHSGFCRTSTR